MDRETALKLVKDHISEENLVKHMLAVEAGMRKLAEYFGEDTDEWGLAGLLHDIDYEETKDDPDKHTLIASEMLEDKGVSDRILSAIKAHADQKAAANKMEKAIRAIDPLTGLIVAGALVHPEGLKAMDSEFIMNRYKEKSFARSADRDIIASCLELGLKMEEFFALVLEAMQDIDDQLGL